MDRDAEDVCTDAEDNTESLRSLVSKAEKRLAKETQELALKRRVADAMPPKLALKAVQLMAGGYKCDASVKFVMTERPQAVALLTQLPPMEVVLLKGACTSLIPKKRLDPELKAGQRIEDIAAVHFNAEGYGGGYSREEFVWWTELEGLVVQVRVEMERTRANGIDIRACHTRHASGGISMYRWQWLRLPPGLYIDWWDADKAEPGKMTVYWLPQGDLGQKMLQAGERIRSKNA